MSGRDRWIGLHHGRQRRLTGYASRRCGRVPLAEARGYGFQLSLLRCSKSNQKAGAVKYMAPNTVGYVGAWLNAAGHVEGALFWPVTM